MSTVTKDRTARGALAHPDVTRLDDVNRDVLKPLTGPPGKGWWMMLALCGAGIGMFFGAWGWQIYRGMGVSGLNAPVGWGVYITTFVFWVGIAHSGTLISAILFLFRAPWRQSIYRAAEAMTVFAVMTAGLFPLIHVSELPLPVAELQVTTGVGCFCSHDVLHCVCGLLLPRYDSRCRRCA